MELRRSPGVGLGLLQFLSASAFLAWGLWPPTPQSPDRLDQLLALLLLALAAVSMMRAAGPMWWLQVSAGTTAALLVVGVLTRATPQGLMTVSILLLLLAVDVATFLPPRVLAVHLATYAVAFTAAQWVNPASVDWLYVVVAMTAMVAVSLLTARLVGEQRRLADQLQHEAVRDPLTGAYNRRGADEAAVALRAVADRAGSPVAVVAIDLDGFKQVNDLRGHEAGDVLLRELVQQWHTAMRAGDVLARMGGDEFVLVLPNTDPEHADDLLRRMRALHPARWSAGVAEWPSGESFRQALRRADLALYRAKAARAPQRERDGTRP